VKQHLQLVLALAAALAAFLPVVEGQTAAKSAKSKAKPAAAKAKPAPPKAKVVPVSPVEYVARSMAASIPVSNPGALVPFFEQLYRHQRGELPGPVKILQYGDSHTAADEFTGELRALLQSSFGNGGSGFSLAGSPWKSYRRKDVKSGSTRGWYTDGLTTRTGDGYYGLGGVSMTATRPHESIYVEADAAQFELFYYQQPGGGSVQLFDSGFPIDLISTEGEAGPGYYRVETAPGLHRFELETQDRKPVRLFGWVAENPTGVTYEPLGINGAQAEIVKRWNVDMLVANMDHRNPDLIVLAYGTNEAGSRAWTLESYRAMFAELLARFRAAAPAASILVIGPPDRDQRVKRKWQTLERVGMIAEAQKLAAFDLGCAFIDMRAKMGGSGSMLQWVKAGMAQADHVHLTSPGYRMLGEAVFRDLMTQYGTFLEVRPAIMAEAPVGPRPPL
jgi:lysophospholipase L1-like esterase